MKLSSAHSEGLKSLVLVSCPFFIPFPVSSINNKKTVKTQQLEKVMLFFNDVQIFNQKNRKKTPGINKNIKNRSST